MAGQGGGAWEARVSLRSASGSLTLGGSCSGGEVVGQWVPRRGQMCLRARPAWDSESCPVGLRPVVVCALLCACVCAHPCLCPAPVCAQLCMCVCSSVPVLICAHALCLCSSVPVPVPVPRACVCSAVHVCVLSCACAHLYQSLCLCLALAAGLGEKQRQGFEGRAPVPELTLLPARAVP